MAITVARAKTMCTRLELQLVQMSMPREVVKLDARELTAKIKRSRDLRDKWRDLGKSQTRKTKVKSPQKLGGANQQSAYKAQLFAETLARYESQWRAVRSDSVRRPSAKNPKIAKPASTPKRQRDTDHRATRAAVRGQLSVKMAERNASSTATKAKRVARKTIPRAAADEPAAATKTTKGKETRKRGSASSLPKTTTALTALPRGVPPTAADKQRDMRARTTAKKNLFKKAGQIKIRAHGRAQQQRNQARRDSK